MPQDFSWSSQKPILALIGPCLSVVLAALGISVAAVTLPKLTIELADTRLNATLAGSIYTLVTMALIVPVERV